MADINQVITLGIGTPSGIKEFLTFGLQIGVALITPSAPSERTFEIGQENRTFEIGQENRTFEVK